MRSACANGSTARSPRPASAHATPRESSTPARSNGPLQTPERAADLVEHLGRFLRFAFRRQHLTRRPPHERFDLATAHAACKLFGLAEQRARTALIAALERDADLRDERFRLRLPRVDFLAEPARQRRLSRRPVALPATERQPREVIVHPRASRRVRRLLLNRESLAVEARRLVPLAAEERNIGEVAERHRFARAVAHVAFQVETALMQRLGVDPAAAVLLVHGEVVRRDGRAALVADRFEDLESLAERGGRLAVLAERPVNAGEVVEALADPEPVAERIEEFSRALEFGDGAVEVAAAEVERPEVVRDGRDLLAILHSLEDREGRPVALFGGAVVTAFTVQQAEERERPREPRLVAGGPAQLEGRAVVLLCVVAAPLPAGNRSEQLPTLGQCRGLGIGLERRPRGRREFRGLRDLPEMHENARQIHFALGPAGGILQPGQDIEALAEELGRPDEIAVLAVRLAGGAQDVGQSLDLERILATHGNASPFAQALAKLTSFDLCRPAPAAERPHPDSPLLTASPSERGGGQEFV